MIDIKEIRLKKFDDIQKMLNDLLDEQFKLKLQAASGQLAQSSEKKRVKKDRKCSFFMNSSFKS